ncbi:MAG: DMT family transporter [Bosea sp. (in: a-proteobacteria)]
MHDSTNNRRGIMAMLAAMLLFVCNDALVKLAAAHFPIGQLIAVRAVFAALTALVLVFALGHGSRLGMLLRPIVLTRAFVEGAVAALFITALAHLPLANITAILMAASLFVIVLAVILGIERVGWRRWAAVLVGFIGVLFVVQPTLGGFNFYSLLALGSAALVAVREIITRKISEDVPSVVVALATTMATGTVGAMLGLGEVWVSLAKPQLVLLITAAVLVSLGNLAIIMAFRGTDVSVISGYRYSIVIFALVMGYLVWGDIPDRWSILGTVLIVGSGLYTLHRQRIRSRQDAMTAPVP